MRTKSNPEVHETGEMQKGGWSGAQEKVASPRGPPASEPADPHATEFKFGHATLTRGNAFKQKRFFNAKGGPKKHWKNYRL